MSGKKTILAAVCSVLLTIAGLIFLLDGTGTAFIGAAKNWYVILAAFAACMLLAYAVVAKAPIYFLFSMPFAGLFIMLLIPAANAGVTHAVTWPIIPMFCGLGLIGAHFLSKRRIGYLKTGLYVFFVACALLAAAAADGWIYVLPAVLLLSALFILIAAAITHKKNKKSRAAQVIYVEPGEDETNDGTE